MDRKQLRALVAVAEHRSFSGAARSLDTVQSNISAHIARLERELGVTLIDRATTEPTDEGRTVLERARRIEAEFEALDSDVASLRDVVSGQVRLGLIGTTARWLVPPLRVSCSVAMPATLPLAWCSRAANTCQHGATGRSGWKTAEGLAGGASPSAFAPLDRGGLTRRRWLERDRGDVHTLGVVL